MTPGAGSSRPRGGGRGRRGKTKPPTYRLPVRLRVGAADLGRFVVRVPLDPASWTPGRLALVAGLLLIAAGAWLILAPGRAPSPPASPARVPVPTAGAGGYLVCAWNVENLFDDEDDPADHDADDDWFARDPGAVAEKVDLLARALLLQNGGRGPDVAVLVEVESRRAAALLRDALNDRLSPADRYSSLVFRENRVGRRVAPAVLARLPVRDDLTRSWPKLRILEAHLEGPGGASLVVLACHWTSRLRDGGEKSRAAYAAAVYQAVSELVAADPGADVLIAGDFNTGPDDPVVTEGLHAVSERGPVVEAARQGGPLRLLDLTARLDPARDGTYFYRGTWAVYDHLVASPGLLATPGPGSGWRVLPETVRTEHPEPLRTGRDGRPWRFGGPNTPGPRGPSDHFAVSVRLVVD